MRRSLPLLGIYGAIALLTSLPASGNDPVTGPYKHANLSIYLIHGSGGPAKHKLLTLQEAMDQKKAVVYETGSVNELSIENQSSEDVFVQSGDIVKGGRQDRVLTSDFLLPAHSGKLPITAFCVEEGRWTKRGAESPEQFGSSNAAVAGKALKVAVRADKNNQSEVWQQVAVHQQSLGQATARSSGLTGWEARAAAEARVRANTSSSMELALEDGGVTKALEGYKNELTKIVDAQNDVVGFAYSVNGKLSGGDVYESHELFLKMWPKLLQASAVEAFEEQGKPNASAKDPGIPAVQAMLTQAEKAPAASKTSTGRVTVTKKETSDTLIFETRGQNSESAWMHRDFVVK